MVSEKIRILIGLAITRTGHDLSHARGSFGVVPGDRWILPGQWLLTCIGWRLWLVARWLQLSLSVILIW
jgi:hypothetical protein